MNGNMRDIELVRMEEKFIEKYKLYNDPHFYIDLHQFNYSLNHLPYFNRTMIRLLPTIFRPHDSYGELDVLMISQVYKISEEDFINCECETCGDEIAKWIKRSKYNSKKEIWDDKKDRVDSLNLKQVSSIEPKSIYIDEFDKIWEYLGCLSYCGWDNPETLEDKEMILYVLFSIEVCNYLIDENIIQNILNLEKATSKYYQNPHDLWEAVLDSLVEKWCHLFEIDNLDMKLKERGIFRTLIEYFEINTAPDREIYHIDDYFRNRDDVFGWQKDELSNGIFSQLKNIHCDDSIKLIILNCFLERGINSFRNINHLKNKKSILSIQDIILRGEGIIANIQLANTPQERGAYILEEDFYRHHILQFYKLSLIGHLLIEKDSGKISMKCKEYEYYFSKKFQYNETHATIQFEQTVNFVNTIVNYYTDGLWPQNYQMKRYILAKRYSDDHAASFVHGDFSYPFVPPNLIIGKPKEMSNYYHMKTHEPIEFSKHIETINSEDPFFELIISAYNLKNYISNCLEIISKNVNQKDKSWEGMGIVTRKKNYPKRKSEKLRLYNLLGLPTNIKSGNKGRRREILFEHQNKNVQKIRMEIHQIVFSLDTIINKNNKEINSLIKHPINILCTIDHLLQFTRCCISANYYDIEEHIFAINLQIRDLRDYYTRNDYFYYAHMSSLSQFLESQYEGNREFIIKLQVMIMSNWDAMNESLHFPSPIPKDYSNSIERKLYNGYYNCKLNPSLCIGDIECRCEIEK